MSDEAFGGERKQMEVALIREFLAIAPLSLTRQLASVLRNDGPDALVDWIRGQGHGAGEDEGELIIFMQ